MNYKKKPCFLFGDIVVVERTLIGVVVKTWQNKEGYYYEVYVRNHNMIREYKEHEIAYAPMEVTFARSISFSAGVL